MSVACHVSPFTARDAGNAVPERMDHLHQVYDIEHSQPGGCLNIRPVWRHVGAFEDQGADLGVLGTEPLRHPDMLSTGSFDVERI